MEPNYSSLGVHLAHTEHQSWFEGIQGHILCLWLIIPTAKSWCFPSTHPPNFSTFSFICQILQMKAFSTTSEVLQYQLLSSCYLYTIVMSTLVCTLWCSVAPSFTGKLNNFKSRAVLTFHYSLLRKHTNNPAVEAVISTAQSNKKNLSPLSTWLGSCSAEILWALNSCRNQT